MGNDLQTVLLLYSAFPCIFRFFGLSPLDTVTTLMLSHLASFLPFPEVIPAFFSNFQGFIILIYLPFLSWESYFRHTILSMMLVMTVVMTVVMVMMFVMMVVVVVMSVVLAIAVIVLVPVVVIAVYPVAERIVMG